MAVSNSTIWEIRASATTGNVNGGGFNPGNANFPTDATTDANTANTDSPVLSSATYNFVAGDVGAWVYIKSGTNWTPGFYQIASVASNKATLSAAVGEATQLNAATSLYEASTVAGCATVGTPTGGTFGVDYSQQDTANQTATDYAAVGASTTLTSATGGFSPVSVGNIFHQTTTGTGGFGVVGWYEIVSYTNATTVVLDRTPNTGTASVACTGYVGGAGRLNGLEDSMYEIIPAGSLVYIKSGTYSFSASVSIASSLGTTILPIFSIGYTTIRGDTCNNDDRPLFSMGANSISAGSFMNWFNIRVTGTAATVFTVTSSACALINCKFLNTSTTASRAALSTVGSANVVQNCDIASQNGIGVSNNGTGAVYIGSYIHDSVTGISGNCTGLFAYGCLFSACSTAALALSATTCNAKLIANTFYGIESKIGIGANLSATNSGANIIVSNIMYGLTTGVSVGSSLTGSNISVFNDYFNNTTDVTNVNKKPSDMAIDPAFVGATQLTGTTATTAGSVLTDGSADFSSVTDNVDFVRVTAGTGTTLGCYLITAHTSTTLTTNNALGTNATADKVYYVTTGTNFQIGSALAGLGFPNFTGSGSETTSYPDVGGVQRQATGGGSGASSTFVC